jgi:hypothetical protein
MFTRTFLLHCGGADAARGQTIRVFITSAAPGTEAARRRGWNLFHSWSRPADQQRFVPLRCLP